MDVTTSLCISVAFSFMRYVMEVFHGRSPLFIWCHRCHIDLMWNMWFYLMALMLCHCMSPLQLRNGGDSIACCYWFAVMLFACNLMSWILLTGRFLLMVCPGYCDYFVVMYSGCDWYIGLTSFKHSGLNQMFFPIFRVSGADLRKSVHIFVFLSPFEWNLNK